VILSGRNEERLAETAALLGKSDHLALLLDLNRFDEIAPAIVKLHEATGPIYGLFHAAGTVETRPLQANTVEVVQAQLNVNLLAGLELARTLCRRDVMTPEGGSLVFVSSAYGHVGVPGQIGYCASKGALCAAVRAMAIELARRHIRVNSISPGLVLTQMTEHALGLLSADHVERIKAAHPLGIGQPDDVARAAVFLLAPSTRWITGADLAVDGGFTAQ
jgi:NAD(P)-dependent dehydrogenase (short-subunit alcohol dehydrogenase family)